MPVDPVYNALSVWIGFYQALPLAIRAVISLSLVMFFVTSTVKFVWDVRH